MLCRGDNDDMYMSCLLVGEAKEKHVDARLGTWYSFEVGRTNGKKTDIIRVLYQEGFPQKDRIRVNLGRKYVITGVMEERVYKEDKNRKDLSLIINHIESTNKHTPSQAIVSVVTKKKTTRRFERIPGKVTFTAEIPKLRKSMDATTFVINLAAWRALGTFLEGLEDGKKYLFIGRPIRRYFKIGDVEKSLVEISLSNIKEVSDGENEVPL